MQKFWPLSTDQIEDPVIEKENFEKRIETMRAFAREQQEKMNNGRF